MRKLVIIPSDPISAYEEKGRANLLEEYYNPSGVFDEVYILSPIENTNTYKYGIHISKETPHSFKKKIEEISPDLIRVYGAYWPSNFIVSVRPRDIPVVISVHDSHPSMIFKSLIFADHIICMSKAVENAVVKETKVDRQKIIVLPNRVDNSIFYYQSHKKKMRDLLPALPEGKAILHVGRKAKQKNLETLISALKYLPEEYYCIFVGRGNKSKFVEQANNERVSQRCFWVESISNSELVDWYNSCSCMCVPSLWEGFGIVFIEAAACGATIVTSNIAPMNEYLKHKENAYLVDEYQSPSAIANAISIVCNDHNLRKTISHNALSLGAEFEKKKIDKMEKDFLLSILNKTTLSNNDWFKMQIWCVRTKIFVFVSNLVKRSIKYILNVAKVYTSGIFGIYR